MRNPSALIIGLVAVTGLATVLPSVATPAMATVPHSHPAWASTETKVGDSPAGQRLTFRIYLRFRDGKGAEATARAVSTPTSPSYRKFLTPQQVRARFGPSQESVTAVRTWLRSFDFRVGSIPSNNAYVEASGTVAQAQRAFHVTLAQYQLGGSTLRAPEMDLTVPATIAPRILGVVGVDQSLSLLRPNHTTGTEGAPSTQSRDVAHPNVVPPGPGFRNARPCGDYYGQQFDTADPAYNGQQNPYAPCGYKPPQLRSAYGMDQVVNSGIDGSGQTIALVTAFASPTIYEDASEYALRNDPSHPLRQDQFKQIVFPPTRGSEAPEPKGCGAAGWYGEETLDVEAAHAMAPGANLLVVSGSDCVDTAMDKALNEVVATNEADIISNSYGDQGEEVSADIVAVFSQIAIQAVLQGIGLYFASGDAGDEAAILGYPSADFAATSPWVTSVGGTTMGIDASGKKVLETGWENGKSTLTGGAWTPPSPGAFIAGSGGGASVLFPQPFYQQGVVPDALSMRSRSDNKRGRVGPDLAALADPNTGLLIGQTQTFPDGAYYDEYRLGGTSLACPLVAGMMALADQRSGTRHGFINPALYRIAGHTPALDDVKHVDGAVIRVDYANGVDASGGLLTSLRTFDYPNLTIHTTDGYDTVTGLGSPNGLNFLELIG